MIADLYLPRDLAGWGRGTAGLWLPEPERSSVTRQKPVGIDFFAGAGGFSLGLHQAGWHVAAAMEIEPDAAATYLVNLGSPDTIVHHADGTSIRCSDPGGMPAAGTGWIASACTPGTDGPDPECRCAMCVDAEPVEHLYMFDVRKITGQRILADLGMQKGDVGCVFGGPPCQGFSMAGKRDVMDPRNTLVFEFARLVLELQPATMVMENVPNILRMVTPAGVPVVDALCRVLSDGGFSTYDALRKSLGATPSARGAVRQEQTHAPDQADEDVTEAGLFELETAGAR